MSVMHRSRSHVAEELTACIHCTECLAVCPALSTPITIETLNQETLTEPISPEVARFAQACFQCGACVPVCPAGLHRDAMMLWIKMRLLRGEVGRVAAPARDGITPLHLAEDERGEAYLVTARVAPRTWGVSPRPGGEQERKG